HDGCDSRCKSPSYHPIRDDDLSNRDIKSDHQETEVASRSNGPSTSHNAGVGSDPHSKMNEPTNVK
ncbi:hypothetical protein, partial [Roseiconus lacunae]|uniref:hypothetical protein n=1 Tax=Roseiconus lacunae TaxID=2605694 RepID=UPI00193ECDFC